MAFNPKFERPVLYHNQVERFTLLSRLDEKRINLIVAPTGYGKSSLVNYWVHKNNVPHVWYNLDENDNRTDIFLNNLLTQFQRFTNQGKSYKDTRLGRLNPKDLQNKLIEILRIQMANACLIIEDYHYINNPEIHRAIEQIALNTQVKLMLTSRMEPPLDLLSLKKTGEMSIISSLDLRLNRAELKNYLDKKSLNLPDALLVEFLSMTGGWFAGVQIVLSNSKSKDELTENLTENTTLTSLDFDQQIDTFLKCLSIFEKEVLLKMSLLDLIDKRFIKFHFQQLGPNTKVNDLLFARDIFLIQLDHQFFHFRYHPLFGNRLRKRALRYFNHKDIESFILQASRCYSERSLLEEAFKLLVDYSIQTDLVFDIHRKLRVDYIKGGRWDKLELRTGRLIKNGWQHNEIDISQAWFSIHDGRTQKLFDQAEVLEKKLQKGELEGSLEEAEIKVLVSYWIYNSSQDLDKCIDYSSFALDNLPVDYAFARGYSWIFLLGSLQARGNIKDAERRFKIALNYRIFPQELEYIWLTMCYCAWMEADLGALNDYSKQLLNLSEQTNNLEAKCHAIHFRKLFAYETAAWSLFQKYTEEQRAVLHYGIGVVQMFTQLLNVSFEKLRGYASWEKKIQSLLGDLYASDQQLLAKYAAGHYLNLALDGAALNQLEKLYHDSTLDVIIPISQNSDPNLSNLAYLYSKPTVSPILLNQLRNDLEHYAKSRHNRMAYLKLRIIELTFNPNLEEKLRITGFKTLIDIALLKDLKGIFMDYKASLEFLSQNLNQFSAIQQDFISELMVKRNQVGSLLVEFTAREIEILKHLDLESSNAELASSLFISEKTLKNHLTSIYKKLGVKSKREAIFKWKPLYS